MLGKLAGDTSELISCVGETHGGSNYCVNMRRIVDLIRIKEVPLPRPAHRATTFLHAFIMIIRRVV